jgi:hypothetical protein
MARRRSMPAARSVLAPPGRYGTARVAFLQAPDHACPSRFLGKRGRAALGCSSLPSRALLVLCGSERGADPQVGNICNPLSDLANAGARHPARRASGFGLWHVQIRQAPPRCNREAALMDHDVGHISGFLVRHGASIMASATPFCFCTTQKHLAVKRVRSSMA